MADLHFVVSKGIQLLLQRFYFFSICDVRSTKENYEKLNDALCYAKSNKFCLSN